MNNMNVLIANNIVTLIQWHNEACSTPCDNIHCTWFKNYAENETYVYLKPDYQYPPKPPKPMRVYLDKLNGDPEFYDKENDHMLYFNPHNDDKGLDINTVLPDLEECYTETKYYLVTEEMLKNV